MKNGFIVFFLFVVGFLLLVISQTGCGKGLQDEQQTGGNPNTGTISGYVYDNSTANYDTRTYTGTPDAKVLVTTTNFSKETTTNSSGYYSLTGLPSGQINITVFKNGYYTTTLITDRSTATFLLSPYSGSYPSSAGGGTISGTITGLPSDTSYVYCYARGKNKSSSSITFTATTGAYTISNAPDDGEIYVNVYYYSDSGATIYTYGKVTVNKNESKTLNLAFGGTNSIRGNVTLPSGYTSAGIASYAGKPFYYFATRGGTTINNSSTYEITNLPDILSGDSHIIWIATGESDGSQMYRMYYNAGSIQNLDLSSVQKPTLKTPSPSDGANLAESLPTFSWDAISGTNVWYAVNISETSPESKTIWSGWTQNTSIAFPSGITEGGSLESGKTYSFYVAVDDFSSNVPLNTLPDWTLDWPADYYIYSLAGNARRSFTF